MATKISHKVQEYPTPYLGIIPKKKTVFYCFPTGGWAPGVLNFVFLLVTIFFVVKTSRNASKYVVASASDVELT